MTFTYVLFWQLTNHLKKKKNNIHGSAILRDIDLFFILYKESSAYDVHS